MEYKDGYRIFDESDIPNLMSELFGIRTPKSQGGMAREAADPDIIEAQFRVIEDQPALGSGQQATNEKSTETLHG